MSQSIDSKQFVLLQLSIDQDTHTALGIYQNEEDAYAAASIHQMQSIEANTANKIGEHQEQLTELCRYIKEDLTSYKQRFEHMTQHLSSIFDHIYHYQVLSTSNASAISESIFKTKLRNFLDAFQTKSDIEEDLGNSDEDEEDDEEEEDIEEAGSDDDSEEEEQLHEEQSEAGNEELEEEELDEDEDETALPELEESTDEEEDHDLKRKASEVEEEEEDEIDEEDYDEDELDDDEESSTNAHKKRRTAAA